MKPNLAQAILLGGLSAGVLDITAACVNGGLHGRSPSWVFQSVAGGWLGRDTFQGGWKTAALGLLTHFFIATVAAAVYCAASLRLPPLTQRAWIFGPLYGVAVYLFMYGIVLRLSAYHSKFYNQTASAILTGVLIHIFCVGLPIALAARLYAR
jgi:hypothetical protein